ncbi:MAG: hypothetical protein KJ583_00045 [Nanoarchaeota archaeon]|nr:hypothetical protein [Nanoarchaeota archaeon]MBU1270245.1 hypothetical protein [Nanoarchaeota archaeon]MBU1603678.1 hypothetical protein [Nanoarchaeota archaeon]MBU2443735.1 hypothetical protein [Nanoarchaeota archaeon]
MVEFNSDGSLKIPESLARTDEENKKKMQTQRCIKINREVLNFSAPKKCVLRITLSNTVSDNRFIDTIYGYFKKRASVPSKLTKVSEKEFEVEIGTDFRRCSNCNSLINEYRELFYGNIIEVKGSCTFEGHMKNFAYEDYFD